MASCKNDFLCTLKGEALNLCFNGKFGYFSVKQGWKQKNSATGHTSKAQKDDVSHLSQGKLHVTVLEVSHAI